MDAAAGVAGRGPLRGAAARSAVFALLLCEFGLSPTVALAFDDEDLGVVGEAVDEGDGAGSVGKTASQRLNGRLVVMSRDRCS